MEGSLPQAELLALATQSPSPPQAAPPPTTGPTTINLMSLPIEIQQHIFSHVYPHTDITLIPCTHADFRRSMLSRDFNLLGYTSSELLQTCSKVCSIAKPVRDTSFSGAVNTYRTVDVAHGGCWIHDAADLIRIISEDPLERDIFLLRADLFSRLKKVVLVKETVSDVLIVLDAAAGTQSPDDTRTATERYLLGGEHRHGTIVLNAKEFLAKFVWGFSTRPIGANTVPVPVSPVQVEAVKALEIDVQLRYGLKEAGAKIVLGVVVRFNRDRTEGFVVDKAVRSKDCFKYHEDGAIALTATPEGNTEDRNGSQTIAIKLVAAKLKTFKCVKLDKIPRQYTWIKTAGEKIDFDDLRQ